MTLDGLRFAHAAGRADELHDLWGRLVRCRLGGRVGTVFDLLVDDAGRVMFWIVSFGSMARVGDDCRLIPADMLVEDDDVLLLQCEQDAVRDAPIFLPDSDAMDDTWWQQCREHYAKLPSAA